MLKCYCLTIPLQVYMNNMKAVLSPLVYTTLVILILFGIINSGVALVLGFLSSVFLENPFKKYTHTLVSVLLKIAVIGLGFGMFIKETIKVSGEGLHLTLLSIVLTVGLGLLLTRLLNLDFKLGHLITSGTSICGGSAIAAIAPVIKAEARIISMALGVVFFLNALALFIFPSIGHWFHLSQHQFGMWCAIAIHDTSSVVGAAMSYGDEALKIATTVKLSRTLWIIPMAIFSMFYFRTKKEKIKFPYFILLFIGAIIANSYHIIPAELSHNIVLVSKRLLVFSLFVVGSTISLKDLKKAGTKPLVLALFLWTFISVFSLAFIIL